MATRRAKLPLTGWQRGLPRRRSRARGAQRLDRVMPHPFVYPVRIGRGDRMIVLLLLGGRHQARSSRRRPRTGAPFRVRAVAGRMPGDCLPVDGSIQSMLQAPCNMVVRITAIFCKIGVMGPKAAIPAPSRPGRCSGRPGRSARGSRRSIVATTKNLPPLYRASRTSRPPRWN